MRDYYFYGTKDIKFIKRLKVTLYNEDILYDEFDFSDTNKIFLIVNNLLGSFSIIDNHLGVKVLENNYKRLTIDLLSIELPDPNDFLIDLDEEVPFNEEIQILHQVSCLMDRYNVKKKDTFVFIDNASFEKYRFDINGLKNIATYSIYFFEGIVLNSALQNKEWREIFRKFFKIFKC